MDALIPFATRLSSAFETLRPPRTQKWLADESGLSEATISRLMQGKRAPDVEMLESLGPVLGLSPEELVRGTDAEERLADSNRWMQKKDYDVAIAQVRELKARVDELETETAAANATREAAERMLKSTSDAAQALAIKKETIEAEKKVFEQRVVEQAAELRLHRRALDDAASEIELLRRDVEHLTRIAGDMKEELIKLGRTSLVTKILAAVAAGAATFGAVTTGAVLLAQAKEKEESEHGQEK